MRTHPFFVDRFPRNRRPDYPRYGGVSSARVVIVGGGLTGTACAAAFAAAGVKVVLLEADRIGGGATGAGAGLLRHDFDVSFEGCVAQHGLKAARHLWEGFRRASLDFAAALRRFGIRCDLGPQGVVTMTREGADGARRLKREYAARRDAGLDVSWLNARAIETDCGIAADGALRVKGEAFDPYRACIGLAAAAAARGGQVFERSRVTRVRAGRTAVEIRTDRGTISADVVLMATGAPIDDLRALRRHLPQRQSFSVVTDAMPTRVRREIGRRTDALTTAAPAAFLLRWLPDDRVLFCGGEQPPLSARARDANVVPNAMELMYRLSTLYPAISGVQPAWGWDVMSHGSPDGLPLVGRHRNFPRHLFAFGGGRHGAGVAWLAARVLLREYAGEPAKHDELFGFARVL